MKLDELFDELVKKAEPVRREPQEQLPKHVLLVVDEQGMAQYMQLLPDGHLGAVEEF